MIRRRQPATKLIYGNNILDSVESRNDNSNITSTVFWTNEETRDDFEIFISDFCVIMDTYYPADWQVTELRQLIQAFVDKQNAEKSKT